MTVATRKCRKAAAARSDPGVGSPPLPYTTQWHRNNGRGTRRDKAIKQQLLTPQEEQAIVYNLYRIIEEKSSVGGTTSDPCLENLLHATEKAFANRSLFHDENESL